MSDFLENLISRHTDISAHVKPDLPGPFETERTADIDVDSDNGFGRAERRSNFQQQDQTDKITKQSSTKMPSKDLHRPLNRSVTPSKQDNFNPDKLNHINEPARPETFSGWKQRNTHIFELKVKSMASPLLSISDSQQLNIESNIVKNTNSGRIEQNVVIGLLTKPANIPELLALSETRTTERNNTIGTPALPTIKVSIGRIDVRAIIPPAGKPVQPEPGPKPLLSLEDYIKQREVRK